jgi:hypothetical protein
MDKKQIAARIVKLGKTVAAVVAEIQEVSIEIVVHAVQHGDVTLADDLLTVCGKGVRRQSLSAWFELVGCMKLSDKGTFELNKVRRNELSKLSEADLRELLASKKWEEAKPEPKIRSVLDASEELDKFFKRIDKVIAEGKTEVKNLALLKQAQRKVQELQALAVLQSIRAADDEELHATYADLIPGKRALTEQLMHLQQQ